MTTSASTGLLFARGVGRAPCAPRRRCVPRGASRGVRSRRTRRCTTAASPATGRRTLRMPVASMTSISPGSTSRTYSAPMRSNAIGSLATTCASFARRQDAEAERADAPRIAHGDDRVLGEEEERVGALRPARARRRCGPRSRSPCSARRGGRAPRCRRSTRRSSPAASSSARSSSALVRLPLWQTASEPRA